MRYYFLSLPLFNMLPIYTTTPFGMGEDFNVNTNLFASNALFTSPTSLDFDLPAFGDPFAFMQSSDSGGESSSSASGGSDAIHQDASPRMFESQANGIEEDFYQHPWPHTP